jgi:hypothetical protein
MRIGSIRRTTTDDQLVPFRPHYCLLVILIISSTKQSQPNQDAHTNDKIISHTTLFDWDLYNSSLGQGVIISRILRLTTPPLYARG